MQDVKIVAPECSNVLNWDPDGPKGPHTAMIDSIMVNADAYAALDIIGYHSYDFGPTKWFRDMVRPSGNEIREIWQTESAVHGREGGEKEIHYAAQQAAIILLDINLLANVWFFFHDFRVENYRYDSTQGFYLEALNLFMITQRSSEPVRVNTWLKTDYVGRLTRSIKPNTWMRFCTSDLQPWYGNDQDRFTYMENTNRDISGESYQICAAGGRRADSSWVLAAVNRTGLPGVHQDTVFDGTGGVAWMKHTYAPADSFNITFTVPELDVSASNVDNVDFTLTRCNMANKCRQEGTVTMVDGSITVATAATELVTLESEAGIPVAVVRNASTCFANSNGSVVARKIGHGWVFTMNSHEHEIGHSPVVQVYSSRGRLLRDLSGGTHGHQAGVRITWDGKDRAGAQVATGVYYVRFSDGENATMRKISVAR